MGFANCRTIDLPRRTVSVQSVTLVYEFCVAQCWATLCAVCVAQCWATLCAVCRCGRPAGQTVQQYTSNFLEEKIYLKTVSSHIVGLCETETTCSAVHMVLNSSEHKTISTIFNVTLCLLSTTQQVPATTLYNTIQHCTISS
jgi:hypothetical protein